MTVEITGLDDVIGHLRVDVYTDNIRDTLTMIGMMIESDAKRNAPVDRGTLRASINHQVHIGRDESYVLIGPNVFYAPYMEYGTGLVHDHPTWPRRHHFVSGHDLAGWGKRVGANPYAVANAINARGGLMPRRFMRDALEDNRHRIMQMMGGIFHV